MSIIQLRKASAIVLLSTLVLLSGAAILADNPSYIGQDAPEFKINRFLNSTETRMDIKDFRGEFVLIEFFKTT